MFCIASIFYLFYYFFEEVALRTLPYPPPSIYFQIDELLDYAPVLSSGSEFDGACRYLDGYLLKRTFLVGHSLSIADLAIWSGLAGKILECLIPSLIFSFDFLCHYYVTIWVLYLFGGHYLD